MKLPHFWQHLPDEMKARFGRKRPGRQRAMAAQGHLLLVLHKAPGADERDREPVFFWRKPDGAWEASTRGGLARLMEHIEEFEDAEARLTQEYEQATGARDYFDILEKVAPLHHTAKNLLATLQAAREAALEDRDLIDARDAAYELDRTLDLLYEDTKNALEFNIAMRAEEEARLSMESISVANRLNLLAAIFLPLTALAGIFGMNLPSGLEGSPTWAFWLVLLCGVLLGVGLSCWAVRGRQKSNAQYSTPNPQ